MNDELRATMCREVHDALPAEDNELIARVLGGLCQRLIEDEAAAVKRHRVMLEGWQRWNDADRLK